MENCNKVCISLSGGLDSTCLLMHYLAKGFSVKAFSFDYGQKHDIELTIYEEGADNKIIRDFWDQMKHR